MAGWISGPVQLHSSREFECDPLTAEECDWYKQRWHFWYIADYVFALPTVAFFMSVIGIFIIGRVISSLVLGHRRFRGPPIWQKFLAFGRYLSYRGFHIKSLQWNSAPVGILLLGLAGTVFFFCMDLIPQPYYWPSETYGNSPPLATRSGWLGLACMPFIFATASKTSWITLFTGISYERLQVFHRWISYAFFILALLHTFPFIVYHIRWHDMMSHFASSLVYYWTGIVALIVQALLTFASHSTVRNLGYEFFKMAHFLAAVVFMVTFFWHCGYSLTSWNYFIATAAVYVPCLVYPWLRTFFEYGVSQKAELFIEENGFTRITISAKFDWTPGQHCFLRFTSFGLLQAVSAHPFTICSSPSGQANEQSELSFYICHQRGFTAKLYQHALEHPGVPVPVLVDGPYGGINLQKYHDSDHLLVVVGGSGAGWCLPFVERFVRHRLLPADVECGQVGPTDDKETRPAGGLPGRSHSRPLSLRVIMVTRDISSRVWFLQTVGSLISKYSTTESSSKVRVQVYLTRAAIQNVDPLDEIPQGLTSSKETGRSTSPAEKNKIEEEGHVTTAPSERLEGRPHLPLIIHEEAAKVVEAGQTLGVFVCGPITMQNDVRNAVAEANLNILKGSKAGGVYLHSEHFSWA